MRTENYKSWIFRRNGAILLLLAAGYLLVTDWILELWSACAAFALIFAITGAIALRALKKDFSLRGSWLLAPLAIIALWGLVQLASGVPEYRFETWWSSLTWAAALASFWSALQVFSPARLSHLFRSSIIVFGALMALEAVLQLFSGNTSIYGVVMLDTPPMGPFRNRDHFCAFIELILPIALWSGIRDRRHTWIYFTATGMMYASVIASQSRAGSVIATLEVVLMLVVGIVRRRAQTVGQEYRLPVAIAFLIAIGGGIVGFGPVFDRFLVEDPFKGRREFLQTTLQMIHDRPWFGFGLGSWPWVYPRYAFYDAQAIANHAHNDWAEWAANGGIPFAFLIAVIVLRAFWLSLELPWGIGTVAVFAHAVVDFPFARPPILFAVLLILAVMELEHARHLEGREPDEVESKRIAHGHLRL